MNTCKQQQAEYIDCDDVLQRVIFVLLHRVFEPAWVSGQNFAPDLELKCKWSAVFPFSAQAHSAGHLRMGPCQFAPLSVVGHTMAVVIRQLKDQLPICLPGEITYR